MELAEGERSEMWLQGRSLRKGLGSPLPQPQGPLPLHVHLALRLLRELSLWPTWAPSFQSWGYLQTSPHPLLLQRLAGKAVGDMADAQAGGRLVGTAAVATLTEPESKTVGAGLTGLGAAGCHAGRTGCSEPDS